MKKLFWILFVLANGAALFVVMVMESAELAKQLFALVAILGFGFFVTIGHRLLAERLVDWWDSKFGEKPDDHP